MKNGFKKTIQCTKEKKRFTIKFKIISEKKGIATDISLFNFHLSSGNFHDTAPT